jgi:hypothetical protein
MLKRKIDTVQSNNEFGSNAIYILIELFLEIFTVKCKSVGTS